MSDSTKVMNVTLEAWNGNVDEIYKLRADLHEALFLLTTWAHPILLGSDTQEHWQQRTEHFLCGRKGFDARSGYCPV